MPVARIITNYPQETGPITEQLQALGYRVEVVAPGAVSGSVDLEIDLQKTSVRSALVAATRLVDQDSEIIVAPNVLMELVDEPAVVQVPELDQPVAVQAPTSMPEAHEEKAAVPEPHTPISQAMVEILGGAVAEVRAASAEARSEIAAFLNDQHRRMGRQRTRLGERLADWAQRRALRRALAEQERRERMQRRAVERELRRHQQEAAAQAQQSQAQSPAMANLEPMPAVPEPSLAEPEVLARPAVPTFRPRTYPARRIHSPRDRQFQQSVFWASLVALSVMLGMALAISGQRGSQMPSALAPANVNIQQQVPFGPSVATARVSRQSAAPTRVRPSPAKPSAAKPSPGKRSGRSQRQNIAQDVAQDDVLIHQYPTKAAPAAQSGGVRHFSDTERAAVRQFSSGNQPGTADDRGIRRISDQQ